MRPPDRRGLQSNPLLRGRLGLKGQFERTTRTLIDQKHEVQLVRTTVGCDGLPVVQQDDGTSCAPDAGTQFVLGNTTDAGLTALIPQANLPRQYAQVKGNLPPVALPRAPLRPFTRTYRYRLLLTTGSVGKILRIDLSLTGTTLTVTETLITDVLTYSGGLTGSNPKSIAMLADGHALVTNGTGVGNLIFVDTNAGTMSGYHAASPGLTATSEHVWFLYGAIAASLVDGAAVIGPLHGLSNSDDDLIRFGKIASPYAVTDSALGQEYNLGAGGGTNLDVESRTAVFDALGNGYGLIDNTNNVGFRIGKWSAGGTYQNFTVSRAITSSTGVACRSLCVTGDGIVHVTGGDRVFYIDVPNNVQSSIQLAPSNHLCPIVYAPPSLFGPSALVYADATVPNIYFGEPFQGGLQAFVTLSGAGFTDGDISPDGNLIVFTGGGSGDLTFVQAPFDGTHQTIHTHTMTLASSRGSGAARFVF